MLKPSEHLEHRTVRSTLFLADVSKDAGASLHGHFMSSSTSIPSPEEATLKASIAVQKAVWQGMLFGPHLRICPAKRGPRGGAEAFSRGHAACDTQAGRSRGAE